MKKDFKNIPAPSQIKLQLGEVKNVDSKKRIVQAYGSKFGNIDSDFDMIMPGAFTKTINENGPTGKNRIFHLWQHKTDQILGKPSIIKEDGFGLYFESQIEDTTLGNDVLKLYDKGIINEHSIGYSVVKFENHEDHFKLTEIRLFEISAVTWGANAETPTVGMKTEDKAKFIFDELASLRKLLRHGGLETEEMNFFLENKFSILEAELKALLQPAPKNEPLHTLEKEQEPLDAEKADKLLQSFFKKLT